MPDDRRRDQFTLDLMEKVPQGAGSGTIWDTDGHVVTNAHVIAGASDLQVCQSIPTQNLAGDQPHPPLNASVHPYWQGLRRQLHLYHE